MNTIIPTVLIALAIAGTFLYVIPEYKDLSGMRSERDNLSASVAKIKEVNEKYTIAKEWQSNIRQEDQKRLSEILPDEFDKVSFLLDLDTFAKKNAIIVGPVDITGPESLNNYVSYGVALSFDAPYSQNAMKFLAGLESSLTLFDVVDFRITNGEGSMLSYSIIFNTYAMK